MSTTNPQFADICALLDQLIPPKKDTNIDSAPHGAFWRNPKGGYVSRDDFVNMPAANWLSGMGNLVTPGNASQSPLYLALTGASPFDCSAAPMMPDTGSDSLARHATPQEQIMVETWINNGAPA